MPVRVIRSCLLLGISAAVLTAQPGHAAPAAGNESVAVTAKAEQAEDAAAKPKSEKATRIPEPGTLALFHLGATGRVLGRRLSRSKRERSSGG